MEKETTHGGIPVIGSRVIDTDVETEMLMERRMHVRRLYAE